MIKKLLCLTLIAVHLLTFVAPQDVLAYIAQSANYKLRTGSSSSEGGCPNNGSSDRSGSRYKILADSVGEAVVIKTNASQYGIDSGFVTTSQSNPPTRIGLIPDYTWKENQSLLNAFCLNDYFTSLEGYALTYTYKNLSADKHIRATIHPTTHNVSFEHDEDFTGTEQVEFTATDPEGQKAISNYINLSVVAIHSPILTIDSVTSTVSETDVVTIKAHATDEDEGDVITFTYTANSAKVELTNAVEDKSLTSTWQTDYSDSGSYDILIRATDLDGLYDEKEVQVTVNNVNRAPVITTINSLPVTAGVPITLPAYNETDLILITPLAQDADSDSILYSYTNLGDADFDSTGKWLTDYDDSGNHQVQVKAYDGTDYSAIALVNVTINNVNRAPVASLTLSDYTINKNDTITITLVASDADSDAMTFSLKQGGTEFASGAIVDTYTTTRKFPNSGNYTIEATVTDDGTLTDTESALIDCVDPNTNRNYINPVMGDFNGDSKGDLGLHNSHSDEGSWQICLSDEGVFNAASGWLSNFGTSRDWIPIGGDFNGDGLTDIGIYNNTSGSDGGKVKIALSTGTSFTDSGLWATFQDSSYDWMPVSGNFNSDRYTDLGIYNSKTGQWKVSLNDGSSFGAFNEWISSFGGEGYTPLTGDFNADGIVDIGIFKKSSGEVKIAFGNSTQFIDSTTTWITGFAQDKNILLADFNNDGATDIGYWDSSSGNWTTATSNGSSLTQSSDIWLASFGSTSNESAHTGDFNGDGITDAAIFDRDLIGIERWTVRLSTDLKPDLLVEVDNGTGGKTNITYDYAAKQENDLLPFAVYVTREVSVTDSLPSTSPIETYTQNFSYSGGYFDAVEREFRGFEKVTVTEPITGNYTQTYFYQGKDTQDGALKGKTYQVLAYDSDSRLISELHSTWEVRKAGPTDGPLGFPHITQTTQTAYEENDLSLTTEDSLTYDNLGSIIATTSLGDITTDSDNRTSNTTYAQAYLEGFSRVLETSLRDQNNSLIVKKTFEYDSYGNLSQKTAWLTDTEIGPSTQYAYDAFGNLTSTTDALGRTVATEYETTFYTFPETVTNVLGHTVTYTYDAKFGAVTSTTDTNNQTSTSTLDAYGRTTQVKNANNEITTSYSYPDFNTKVSSRLNFEKTEYVDGLGRKYKTVSSTEDGDDPKDVIAEVFFDERGFTSHESLPHYIDTPLTNISYIRYQYDTRGRVIKTKSDFPGEGSDAESTISYLAPLQVETTDPKGHRKKTVKDVFGNTREVVEYADGEYHTYYLYDSQNNLIQLTDSQGNITSITYDSLGRKTSMNDPDMGQWSYEYDVLGNLISQTDAKGQTISFSYDQLNRLTQKTSGVTSLATYYYDDASKDNSIGRLSKVIDQNCTTEFFYDNLGREITSEKTIDATTYTIQRSYDTLDRLTSITYPDGEEVGYTYDVNSGSIEEVASAATTYIQDVTYNAKGQIKTIEYGNDVSTDYTYGNDLRLSRILTQNPTQTLQDLNYTFDNNGNITQIVDNLTSNIRSFTYDALDRLTEAQNLPDINGGYTTYQYEYDPIGNMTKKGPVYNLTYMTYGEGTAGPHAVTTAGANTYLYDANGNMTSGSARTLAYDVENRLTSFTYASQTSTFGYDGDGRRVKKTSPTKTTTYIGSLYEVDSDGTIKKHVFLGSNRICTSTDSSSVVTNNYYHSDHLGSSNVITNTFGEQVSLCEYTPYGIIAKEVGSFTTPYKFTGKELDSTGLYYYGARYYDPGLGRFIQADTLVVHPNDPQDLNRYAYCRNNPLNLVDPSGHGWFKKFLGKIIGAIAGAVTFVASGCNFALAMAAYSFVSGTIDTYRAGYSVGQSIGIGMLTGTAAYLGGKVGGAFGEWVGAGSESAAALGSAIFGGAASGAAGGATHAALTGSDVGRAAGMGGAIGGTAALLMYGLTYRGPPSESSSEQVIKEAAKDGDFQKALDAGQKTGGAEGHNAASNTVADSSKKPIRLAQVNNSSKTKSAFIVDKSAKPVKGFWGKTKRSIEWILWGVGRLLYNYNTAPGSPDVGPPPPGIKRKWPPDGLIARKGTIWRA